MTYCAAIRVGEVVHLIADSAVTSSEVSTALEQSETPFGEPYSVGEGRLTEDGATKIFEFDGDAFTFAGNVSSGVALLSRYLAHRRNSVSNISSFELAVTEMSGVSNVVVICALRQENGEIKILMGRPREVIPEIELINDFVSIGASSQIRAMFDSRLLSVREEFSEKKINDAALLALFVATGIATSVRNGTFAHGVGGAFNGVTVSSTGVCWQEDHLVLILRDHNLSPRVATITNREGWTLTRYKVGETPVGGKSIITPFRENAALTAFEIEALRRQRNEVLRKTLYPIKTGKFSFASVIGQQNGHAHVLHMNRTKVHNLLMITPPTQYVGIVNYAVSPTNGLVDEVISPANSDLTRFKPHAFRAKK